MTDVEQMIAGLEARKTRLDLAITALRGLEDGMEPAPAKASPRKTGGRESGSPRRLSAVPSHPRSTPAKTNGRASKTDWDLGRKLWVDDVPTADIAKRLGVSGAGVLYQSRTKKWPKRETIRGSKGTRANPKEAATPEPVAIAAAVPQPAKPRPIAVPRPAVIPREEKKAPVPRRCETCNLVTEKDPCSKCGAKMVNWKSAWS